MGHIVKIEKSTAVIPNINRKMILETWIGLNAPENDHLKRGQCVSGNVVTRHYSWLPTHYDKTVKTVEDMLDLFEFSYTVDPTTNDIAITGYELKSGQEELFFQRVFDLLTGKIFWHSEDDTRWIWNFGKLPKDGSFRTES